MLHNLQALRGLAALLVVFVHLDGLLKPLGDWTGALAFGNAGVDLFFVISGFVMVYTTARRPVTPGAFLLHRIIRIVPLYWALTLLLFAAALFVPSLLQSTRPDPMELVQSLLFIPFTKPNGQMTPLFFLGWTLNCEMAFYLLFAAALAIARGAIGWTVALSVAVLAAAIAGGAVFHPQGAAWHFYTDPMIAEFGLGMLVALAFLRGAVMPVRAAAPLLAAGIVYLLVHPWLGEAPHGDMLKVVATLVVTAALGLERSARTIRHPFVLLVGDASYSLYLVHPFVTQAGAKLTAHLASPIAIVGVTALCWAATVPAAILLHKAVEKPLTEALRRRIGHRRSTVDRAEDRMVAQGHTGVDKAARPR